MSLPVSEHNDNPVASTRRAAGPGRAAGPRRPRVRFRRAGLAVATLLGTGVLATGCVTTSSVKLLAGHPHRPLAFVNCMRTHGEPNMPDPVVEGNSVHITITTGSGVDPGSARFAAAFKACKYLTSPGKDIRLPTPPPGSRTAA